MLQNYLKQVEKLVHDVQLLITLIDDGTLKGITYQGSRPMSVDYLPIESWLVLKNIQFFIDGGDYEIVFFVPENQDDKHPLAFYLNDDYYYIFTEDGELMISENLFVDVLTELTA